MSKDRPAWTKINLVVHITHTKRFPPSISNGHPPMYLEEYLSLFRQFAIKNSCEVTDELITKATRLWSKGWSVDDAIFYLQAPGAGIWPCMSLEGKL